MHPFALSIAHEPGQAIAEHLQDPHLAFIAGGTDLIGLIKDRATLPARLLDINHLPGFDRNRSADRWRTAHWRAGAYERCGGSS
jgi:CO/xanthine dehydrogenase FAD-binding subunit